MGKIIFQESQINLTNGRKGKLAVFMFQGEDDPVAKLDGAVSAYVGNDGYNQYVDINMDNPWTRIIISDIDNMEQVEFDPSKHKMKP
jgi:hypothetical protein